MGSFTITATNGHGELLDQRTATTATTARRSLVAMIERTNSVQADGVELASAVRAAGEWDGHGTFDRYVPT